MVRRRPFKQVDVFTHEPYLGNPVAVVLDGEGLSAQDMVVIARWTNLSETTFVLPPSHPDADYQLRIFTPGGELPFAGHPTLGSAHAWLEHGGSPREAEFVVQEVPAGLVRIRRHEDTLAFAAPVVTRDGPVEEETLDQVVSAFRIHRDDVIAHQWVDNGPGWLVVHLRSAADVLELDPDFTHMPDAAVGAIGAYAEGADSQFELRTFAPRYGVFEDPVCGSMNASVAQWMIRTGSAPSSYRVSQGTCLQRAGKISVNAEEDGTVWIGGGTVTCIDGEILA